MLEIARRRADGVDAAEVLRRYRSNLAFRGEPDADHARCVRRIPCWLIFAYAQSQDQSGSWTAASLAHSLADVEKKLHIGVVLVRAGDCATSVFSDPASLLPGSGSQVSAQPYAASRASFCLASAS